MRFYLHIKFSFCLQVNARNAERALNQEKLEASKLREK